MNEIVQRAARRQRRHLRQPGDQLLPDRRPTASSSPRTSPRSSWACASSAPSATTTRSTAGPWTTTTASPPSSPRSAASRARTPARRSSSTPAAARSKHPVAGRVMPPKFLGGDAPDVAGKDRRDRPRRVARLARQPLLRHATSPTSSGPTSSASASSTRSTTSASPTPPPTRNCSTRSPSGSPSTNYDFKQLVRDICNSPHLPALDPAQRDQRDRREELLPRQPPPDPGRGPARHHQPGHRHQEQVPGPAPGARAVQIADGNTSHLLPHHLRPRHARHRLLLRGEDGAQPLPGPPPAQRRHRQRQDPARRRHQDS